VSVTQRPFDGVDEAWRSLETKSHWIADIQVADALTAGFDAVCLGDDITDGVGKPAETRRHRDRRRDFRWSHGPFYRECMA
jgi:hypothetical protein